MSVFSILHSIHRVLELPTPFRANRTTTDKQVNGFQNCLQIKISQSFAI